MEPKHKINNFNYQAYLLTKRYLPHKIRDNNFSHKLKRRLLLLLLLIVVFLFISLSVSNTRDVDWSNPSRVNFTQTLTFAGNSDLSFQSSLVLKQGEKNVI